jgi:hypothetical protein
MKSETYRQATFKDIVILERGLKNDIYLVKDYQRFLKMIRRDVLQFVQSTLPYYLHGTIIFRSM